MRVLCRHGYFCFYPKNEIEVSRFNSIFLQTLVRVEDYFTFSLLSMAPEYAIKGRPFLGMTASVSFAGKPWEIMRENGFIYDFTINTLKAKSSVIQSVSLSLVDDYWTAESPLVLPGGIDDVGQRIISYDADLDLETSQLKVFEVEYD